MNLSVYGIVLVSLLVLVIAIIVFLFRRRRVSANSYPAAFCGQVIVMYVQPTGLTDAEGTGIYEMHVAVEVPAHSPRYPVVMKLPVAAPFEALLAPGTRIPAYVDPADRQRVGLNLKAAHRMQKNRKGQ